jgi:predicted alpha/beta-hydrolase family hydrolase
MYRAAVRLLLVVALSMLVGCGSAKAGNTAASPRRHPSTVAPSHGASTRGTDPAGTQVTPNPPAIYRPAWPASTVRNKDGYLVDTCVPKRLRRDAIALTDSDGVHLSGLVLGTGTNGVLLSHEQGYSVCSFLDLARKLAARGYQVLLPEYRNHGASQTTPDNDDIDRDARAGLRELERRGAARVFVGGASCGGTTSALVARDVPHLVGVLNMSSPVRCGSLDSIPAFRKIVAPTLFVVSPGDMDGAVESQVKEGYAASAAPNKQLIVNDSGHHGTDMFRLWSGGPALEARVLRFIVAAFTR